MQKLSMFCGVYNVDVKRLFPLLFRIVCIQLFIIIMFKTMAGMNRNFFLFLILYDVNHNCFVLKNDDSGEVKHIV